jgi:hypothetical protein
MWCNFGIQIKYLHPSLTDYTISQKTFYTMQAVKVQLICVEKASGPVQKQTEENNPGSC